MIQLQERRPLSSSIFSYFQEVVCRNDTTFMDSLNTTIEQIFQQITDIDQATLKFYGQHYWWDSNFTYAYSNMISTNMCNYSLIGNSTSTSLCVSVDSGIMTKGYANALHYYEKTVYDVYYSFLYSNRSDSTVWNSYVNHPIVAAWNKNKVIYLNPIISILIDTLMKDFINVTRLFAKILWVKNLIEIASFIPLLFGLFLPYMKNIKAHVQALKKLERIFMPSIILNQDK